jgi:hypothetical protein
MKEGIFTLGVRDLNQDEKESIRKTLIHSKYSKLSYNEPELLQNVVFFINFAFNKTKFSIFLLSLL